MKRLSFLLALAVFVCANAVSLEAQKPQGKLPRTAQMGSLPFGGTINVGTGEAITSLTNAGGLFQQLNSGQLMDNLTVNITSDLTAETGTFQLNQVSELNGPHQIVIQASGGQRLIEGANATSLITLNGADRVQFVGYAFGPQGIVIRNTGSGNVIAIQNDSLNAQVAGCRLEGAGTAVVQISNGTATGNDNANIADNTIISRSTDLAQPTFGVYMPSNTGARDTGVTISGNDIVDFSNTGIYVVNAENVSLISNTVRRTQIQSLNLVGIEAASLQGTGVISGNVIRDIFSPFTLYGIVADTSDASLEITRNHIYNVGGSPGSSDSVFGFYLYGNVGGTDLVENNMISIVPLGPTSSFTAGIFDARNSGTLILRHNSVYLGGLSSGGQSYALYDATGFSASAQVFNNLLFNGRSGVPENYAIALVNTGSATFDHNIYIGTGGASPDQFMAEGGTTKTFAQWQAAVPGRDANSIGSVSDVGPFNYLNIFVSPADLHLNTAGNNPALNRGSGGAAVDFDGQARPLGGGIEIGADEVAAGPTAAEVSLSGRVVTADGRGIKNIRVTVSGGDLQQPVSVVTSSFGLYHIEGLRAGQAYTVSVSGKRFTFSPSVKVVSMFDSMADVSFVGEAF